MSTFQDKLAAEIALALDKIKHTHLHPEEFDHYGRKLYTPRTRQDRGGKALAPRDRLSVRLELLCAVKRWELAMMKEIKADTEAIADAKAHAQTCAGCENEIATLGKLEPPRFAGTPGISPSEIGERFGKAAEERAIEAQMDALPPKGAEEP